MPFFGEKCLTTNIASIDNSIFAFKMSFLSHVLIIYIFLKSIYFTDVFKIIVITCLFNLL